jgi:hypothetical protein
MHRSDQLVRGRRDDRAAFDDLSGLVVGARRPQPREREQLVVGEMEVDRLLLAVAADRPLVEAVCRDQAALSPLDVDSM